MKQFKTSDFHTSQGHFVAEASQLGLPPGVVVREFEMETLGVNARFTLEYEAKDVNGDVMSWYYESEKLPSRVGKMQAIIYND